ncbi:MAG: NAD(P)H-hydrate dehydratase [Armatimonadetes bacterium]|nr:NAD(P)H-hydrate dehydratase [Armatimonadota bacterium]
MKLATAAQMRELDRRTIEEFGLPGLVLMEAAGRSVAEAVMELLPDPPGRPVVVVAGSGNNGGDGFVAARWLHNAGVPVEVCLLPPAGKLRGDAAANCDMALNLDVPVHEEASAGLLAERLAEAAVIVDAVLGIGISGQVRGAARDAIEAVNRAPAPVVAVDIPSGVDANTGAILGEAVRAQVTVTFGLAKVGLFQYPGRGCCGRIRVTDIGIPRLFVEEAGLDTTLTEAEDAAAMSPARPADMHKGDAGRLLVVAGSRGMTGAAALSALAAGRSGTGLVYLACPASLNDILEVKCTEVLTRPMPETEAGSLSPEAGEALLEAAATVDAALLGPGVSQHPDTAELMRRLAVEIETPVVIDADGLNAFAGRADELARRSAPAILTPHPGEMARLTGASIAEVSADRPAAARALAAETGAVVVLKGAGTVTAAPDGEVWINPTGNQALASGGSGDVLAGMIAAFAAAGAEALEAAVAGVWYHGRAADVVAPPSRRGLLASDLLAALPDVFSPIHPEEEP